MDSLPPLLSSESMISIDLPSIASKEDNISMMSSDSCQMDIMGELHSADALGGLHSADAADVTQIITSGLKNVDCSKINASDVPSLEMEHLSINDEDYNELLEEKKRHKRSVNSLSYDDNLKNNIGEGASLQKEWEKSCSLNFKESSSQKDTTKDKLTNGIYRESVGYVDKDNPDLIKDDNIVAGTAYISPDVDQDLDAINEIITLSSSDNIITEKSRLHDSRCAKKEIVKNSADNQLNESVKELEIEANERDVAATDFSPEQQGGRDISRTVMHAVEFALNSDEDTEASGDVGSESGLRERGGSSRNKPNKFSSSSVPLRRILPKTAVPTSGSGTNATGVLDNSKMHASCLEASIPSVVQEAINQNHISPGVVTDGIHPLNWQQAFLTPSPVPNTHPQQSMYVQAQTLISNNIPVHAQHKIFGGENFSTLNMTHTHTSSYLQQLQQQQQQQQQQLQQQQQQQQLQRQEQKSPILQLSSPQTNSCQIRQTTIRQPYNITPEIHQGSSCTMINTNHNNVHNDLIENPALERAQYQGFPLSNSLQLPIDSDLFHDPSQQQQQLHLQQKTHLPLSSQQYISSSLFHVPYSNESPTLANINQQSNGNSSNNFSSHHQNNSNQQRCVPISSLAHQNMNQVLAVGNSFHNEITQGKRTSGEEVMTLGKQQAELCTEDKHRLRLSMMNGKHKGPKRLGNASFQPGSGMITTVKSAKVGNGIGGAGVGKKSEAVVLSQKLTETCHMNQNFNIPHSTHRHDHNQSISFNNDAMNREIDQELEKRKILSQNCHASSTTSSTTTTIIPNSNQSQNENFFHNDTLNNMLEGKNEMILLQNACTNAAVFTTLSPNSGICDIDYKLIMEQEYENALRISPALVTGQTGGKVRDEPLIYPGSDICVSDQFLPGDCDLDLSTYLGGSDKTSNGSGERINNGSLEKYLNSNSDDVNNINMSSTIAPKDMDGKHGLFWNRNENSQQLIEEGNIDVNGFRHRMTMQGYKGENEVVSRNLHNCESLDNSPNLALAHKNSELKMNNINLSQPPTSYSHSANIPITVHENLDILQAPLSSIGNNLSSMSDQLMQSPNNSLNNLSCSDSDTSRSRHLPKNHVSNNSMNISVNAASAGNIVCFPQHGSDQKSSSSTHRKNPTNQAASQRSSKHMRHKASSSENSQKKKSKERHGCPITSMANWIINSNGDSGGALADNATAHSMFLPQQEFHDPPLPHQHKKQHHRHHHHHQAVTSIPSSKQSDTSEINFQSSYIPSNHHLQGHRQRQHQLQLQQLQQQLQQQQQQQHIYNPQGTNDKINVPTSSHNHVANRIPGHSQTSSLLPQTTTALSSLSSSSSNPHLQPLHYLQSRGSSINAESSPPQLERETKNCVISSRESTKISRSSNHPNQINDPRSGIRTTSPATTIKTATQRQDIPLTKLNVSLPLAEQTAQERAANFVTKTSSPSSGLQSPMDSTVGVTHVESLDSDLSMIESSNSSMQSKQRWLESLGVDDDEETPLHCLCDMPQDQAFYQNLKENKNFTKMMNHLNNQQQTALFVAVVKEKPEVVRFLVENDADVNIPCKSYPKRHARASVEYQTAIHEAVECGNVEILKTLLTYDNADADAKRHGSSLTPLMLALTCHSFPAKDNSKIIQLLLNHRASLDERDVEGRTPLMFMVMSGDIRIVRTVLKIKGVQAARELVTVVTKKMMTCLHYAAALKDRKVDRERKMELLKLLIQHGADPDKLNAERQSPRHWASNEIATVMSQLKNKIVADGVSDSDSPRNSPQYNSPINSPQYKPGAGDEG